MSWVVYDYECTNPACGVVREHLVKKAAKDEPIYCNEDCEWDPDAASAGEPTGTYVCGAVMQRIEIGTPPGKVDARWQLKATLKGGGEVAGTFGQTARKYRTGWV